VYASGASWLAFSILRGGALISEQIFAWAGVGQLTVKAIVNRDYPVLQGVILTVVLLGTLVNIVVPRSMSLSTPGSGSSDERTARSANGRVIQ
jgi:ABC-type dipeptide/oligopeptide/nickel transport system permease component